MNQAVAHTNFVVILANDLGWMALRSHGNAS